LSKKINHSMKLIEALEILRKAASNKGEQFSVFLACGFTPLHLKTLLAAELHLRRPHAQIEIQTGVYGDLRGSLDQAASSLSNIAVVVIEWPDLDLRLGIRAVGGWTPALLPDILSHVRESCRVITNSVEKTSGKIPTIVCVPTLPLPPVAHTPRRQASAFDAEIRASVAEMSATISRFANVTLVNPQWLDEVSPLSDRFDPRSEVLTGFPYRNAHTSRLAEALASLVDAPVPKKGLITDLDETTWKGILGEVGWEGVSWDLDHHSHMHALYQQLLHALSASGVLVGVASKNDSRLVEELFAKRQPILPKDAVFPIEANWGPKSESVHRILEAWNIGPDTVVFVDDSPTELAEVKVAYPEVECIQFPSDDPQGIYDLLQRLRDLFGKSTIREEDTIRLSSLRSANLLQESDGFSGFDDRFLERTEAELTISFNRDTFDPRALELLNKTNQFNLNGRRYTPTSLQKYVNEDDAFLMVVSYKDKYGPLGKIAVVAGHYTHKRLSIDAWVMSCRAFSRRIEHRCLEELLSRFDCDEIEVDFVSTPRNEPLRRFLSELSGGVLTSPCLFARHDILRKQPKSYHRVLELING
jgi:FkbH-like protein